VPVILGDALRLLDARLVSPAWGIELSPIRVIAAPTSRTAFTASMAEQRSCRLPRTRAEPVAV